MPWSLSPFPWWLWLLVGVWAGVWVFWQRVSLTSGWQRAVLCVGVIYTVLILSVSTKDVTHWSFLRGLFWCAGSLALAGNLFLLASAQTDVKRWGTWFTSCGTAGMLVLLDAELAAALALICGSWLAWGPTTQKEPLQDIAKGRVFRIAHRDSWLLVVALTVGLTGWLGVIRQTAWQEMLHVDFGRWTSVQPRHSRSARESQREKATNQKLEHHASALRAPEAEAIGLGAILLWTCFRLRTRVCAL